jgi:hypothetical protein
MAEELPILPGDVYEDCAFHPVLCIGADGDEFWGISLVDGSYPRSCSVANCGVRKLTVQQAWEWRVNGPADLPVDVEMKPTEKWWVR